jgi:DNA-binding Xre family transcriptional regulator
MYGQNKRREEKEYGKKAVQLNNTITERKDFEELKCQAKDLNNLYENTPTFKEMITAKLKKAKMPIAKLAQGIGLSEKQFRRIRDEDCANTTFPTVIAICLYLEVTLSEAEKLLNAKRYTLKCDNAYVQLCEMFILRRLSIETSNLILLSLHLPTLTNEDWA